MKPSLPTLVRNAADALFSGLRLEKVLITVRHPRTGEIAQIEHDRHTPDLSLSRGYAMIAEPVHHSGRQVGQIELHAAATDLKATQLLQLAQSLHDEIAQALAA